jgi:glycosyltransferase involved in cell wall biosynthesis
MLPSAVWTMIRLLGGMIAAYGKAVRVTKRLIMRARGIDTPLRTRDIPLDTLPDQPGSVEAATALRRRLRDALTPAHRFLQGIRYARIAGAAAAAMKPVAYQCHDLNSILAGFRARQIHPAPLIYDAHELWPHRNRVDARRRKTWVMERADRYFSRRVDAVITVNESIAKHMEKRYGLDHVIVLRNIPALAARDAPPPFGVLDDFPHPRLVYVGGIQTNRGIEQVIDALRIMPGVAFFAVGPGHESYRDSLKERAVEAGVGDRVRFVDRVPITAVVNTVAQGDLGMCLFQASHLSYYWTLPNKFFEYIHAGVPVVASDFPETRHLVDTYDLGAVCDPGDPADIAAKVNDLLSRPKDLERMRENAAKAALELNWERESEILLSVYRRLAPQAFA